MGDSTQIFVDQQLQDAMEALETITRMRENKSSQVVKQGYKRLL